MEKETNRAFSPFFEQFTSIETARREGEYITLVVLCPALLPLFTGGEIGVRKENRGKEGRVFVPHRSGVTEIKELTRT